MEKNQVFITYNGTVEYVGKKEKITDKFWKQELRVNCDMSSDKFPAHVTFSFQASNQKMKLLDGLGVGHDVSVGFKINSREYKGGYFTTLSIVSINGQYNADGNGKQGYSKGQGGGNKQSQSAFDNQEFFEDDNDQLPF